MTNSLTSFQSTRPVRGATICLFMVVINEHISIHAPRAGRDTRDVLEELWSDKFQSTRPVRGATFFTL